MTTMSPKNRMLAAITGRVPDRLPVTTHHVMPYFLKKYMRNISNDEFFKYFGLDPIVWTAPYRPDIDKGEYSDPKQSDAGFLDNRRIFSDSWRIEEEVLKDPVYHTVRYTVHTPGGSLSTVLQSNEYTTWVVEHLVKDKKDIEIIEKYVTHPLIDVDMVNTVADRYGDNALIRSHICCFDIFGQPGCWQDASCLFGDEKLIMETYDDPEWVKEFLEILKRRKMTFIKSLKGAKFDLLELGGGSASTTVISPLIFNEFVAPYDSELISEAHHSGQRIVYHTCGGMMPILEDIADMKPDAMETFTPPAMGGDTDLAEAKRRIGERVCMIGGFDQYNFFRNSTPEQTRDEVRRCFEQAGSGGRYILSPSDHFFDADIELIKAFADEATRCFY